MSTVLEEHAFVPGDGEMTHFEPGQCTGCGAPLSEHEEGAPCCFPFMSTRGQQHAFGCDYDGLPGRPRPASFAQPAAYNVHEDDAAADAYERSRGL